MNRKTVRRVMLENARVFGIDYPPELAEFVANELGLLDSNNLVPDWIDTMAVDVVYELEYPC